MSCMLNIIGEDLDIDVFLIRSKLSPHKKTYKGAPKFKTKPDGERIAYSVVTFKVSDGSLLVCRVPPGIYFIYDTKTSLPPLTQAKSYI